MSVPNFFADMEVIETLLRTTGDEYYKKIAFSIDLTELPLWIVFRSDYDKQTLTAYMQGIMYTKDETQAIKRGTMTVDRKTGVGKIEAESGIADSMQLFYEACDKLASYLIKNNLNHLCQNEDPEHTGILLTVKNDILKLSVVRGSERPDITYLDFMFNANKGRTYMEDVTEDFMDSVFHEMISDDDKIAAAEAGDEMFGKELAFKYLNGDEETLPDPEKAVYWFEKTAERGDSDAMYNMGLFYAKGFGVERDFDKAAEWMRKAARAGDEDAPKMAEQYSRMKSNLFKAKNGSAEAQAELALDLMQLAFTQVSTAPGQDDNSEDLKQSIYWALDAAERQSPLAMRVLGLAYMHGRGVAPDIATAIDYFEKGAELGDVLCMNNLAYEYLNGNHIKQNKKKAFEWFKRAAELGNGDSMYNLARCYQFGHGCPSNQGKALEWYEKAAKYSDNPEAKKKAEEHVRAFRQIAEIDPHFYEDFEGEPDDDNSEQADEIANLVRGGLGSGKVLSASDKAKMGEFFLGKNFVLTGLGAAAKVPVRNIIEENGGVIKSSTVLDTDYLIYDERSGTGTKKYNRALELNETRGKNIKLIPLSQFNRMVESLDFAVEKNEKPKPSPALEFNDPELTAKAVEIERANEKLEAKRRDEEREAYFKAKADERRKAIEAEERRKAEEEERKKAEERRKAREYEKEAAEHKRKFETAEWEKKVEKLKIDREKEEKERIEQIKSETADKKKKLLRIKEDQIAECLKEITDLKQQIEDDKKELNSLGVFKFSRKKELKLAIENNTAKIKECEDRHAIIQKEYESGAKSAEAKEATELLALAKELEVKYAIPDSPEEIERKRLEEALKRKKCWKMNPLRKRFLMRCV